MRALVFALSLFVMTILGSYVQADSNPYLAELQAKAVALQLSAKPQWLNLGHYQKNLFSGYESQAVGPAFFLAVDGKTSPQNELLATLAGFFEAKPEAGKPSTAQCQMPARFIWLNQQLHFDPKKLPAQACPAFEKFRDSVAAKSVTVIFTSYYLNNPSSAFGHSFLRLNKAESAKAGERYELLDYGINYAAEVNTQNPIIYALKGLAGLFPGTFTSIPFYYKVREYNDYESRDLWSYDLNLTPDQIKLLVAHIWELGSTFFRYLYLSQNCSYHILSLLDAVNPELKLVENLPHFFVIPVETIKTIVKTPGLVKAVGYRPALRTQLKARFEKLNSDEKTSLYDLIKSRNSDSKNIHVLDTALDYVDFKFPDDILLKNNTQAAAWKQRLLLTRSQIPQASEELLVEPDLLERPDLGHESIRAGVSYGVSDAFGQFSTLSFRFALHDLMDPPRGYPDYAQIEFVGAKLRYNFNAKSVWLEDFTLFSVMTLSDWTRLNHQLSWRFKLGSTTIRDQDCQECSALTAEGGAGFNWRPVDEVPLSLYGMGEAEVAYSALFNYESARFGVGPAAGVRLRVGDRFVSMVESGYRFYLGHTFNNFRYKATARYEIFKDIAVDINGSRFPDSWETSVGAYYYF